MFRSDSSRKLLSLLTGKSLSVGGLFFVTSSLSTKPPLSRDHIASQNDGIFKLSWFNTTHLDSLLISSSSPFCIQSTKCENGSSHNEGYVTKPPVVSLRKRMTSIGHFSLKSETLQNLSMPVFFIALSGHEKRNNDTLVHSVPEGTTKQSDFTLSELDSIWAKRNMANLHPRFHSTVCTKDDRYFIERTPVVLEDGSYHRLLQNYATETLHPLVYRTDLQKRIEYLLTQPIETSKHLWEVYISNGALGSSGAISKKKATTYQNKIGESPTLEEIKFFTMDDVRLNNIIHPSSSKLRESLLLFRAHHSLADAVSLVAAFGDLVDEADEINLRIKDEFRLRFKKLKRQHLLQRLCRFLMNCFGFLIGCLHAFLRHCYLMVITDHNPFILAARASKLLNDDGYETAAPSSRRSVSWCEITTVGEAKSVAKSVGSHVTINDVFVSCVTRAIAHQLSEHRRRAILETDSKALRALEKYINIVIPVHLFGGVHIPGSGMGNRIGAFVARVPCELGKEKDETVYSSIKLLESVHASLQAVKNTPASVLSYLIAKTATACLPQSLVKYLFRQMSANAAAVITNTKGFPMKVHINGRSVEAVAGFFPLPPGIPIGVVVQSYDDIISISVTAEEWAVPDADKFLGWILEEYTNLLNETKLNVC